MTFRRAATLISACAIAAAPLAFGEHERARGADPSEHLVCTTPLDAPSIDRMLLRAGSPLAGEGGTFVRAGTANDVDPRFLVAVAAHETLLETYGPSQEIRNPFGLGPGIAYDSEEASIEAAAEILGRWYLGEGRTGIGAIASKWAPVGAANDPTDLNSHWTTGVGHYYRALGGDPDGDVRFSQQVAPPCAGAERGGLDGSLIWIWDGREPVVAGEGATAGADPATGGPAAPEGFVFPLAARPDQAIVYTAPECAPDNPCSVALNAAEGTPAVAPVAGTLRAASAEEQADGIGFWIEAGADRFGYSPLAEYAAGAADGASVTAGQVLGASSGTFTVRWERGGAAVNPYPMLDATRPAGA